MSDSSFYFMYFCIACIMLFPPLWCSEVERIRWWRRLRQWRWDVSVEDYYEQRRTAGTDNTNLEEGARTGHNGKTSAFEAEIRESFLVDKLKSYTKTLNDTDFVENVFPGMEAKAPAEYDHVDYNNFVDEEEDQSLSKSSSYVQRIEEVFNDYNNYVEPPDVETSFDNIAHDDDNLDASENENKPSYTTLPTKGNDDSTNLDDAMNTAAIPRAPVIKDDDGFTSDNNSSDESVDMRVVEGAFDDADVSYIKLPLAGEMYVETTNDDNKLEKVLDKPALPVERNVPGGCVICLCPYERGDKVTWSSNKDCNHCFHNECLLDWLKTSGRKSLKRARRNRDRQHGREIDIVAEITAGPWSCPVCRQDFIAPSVENDNTSKVPNDIESQVLPVAVSEEHTDSTIQVEDPTTPVTDISAPPDLVETPQTSSDSTNTDIEQPIIQPDRLSIAVN